MPEEIVVFAVNIQEVTEFTEEMTRKVREAIPRAVNVLKEEARAIVSEVYVIGDAKRARQIVDAKHDGAFVGRLI